MIYKTKSDIKETGGQIILYKNKLEVRLEAETIWLTQPQIAELFGTQ